MTEEDVVVTVEEEPGDIQVETEQKAHDPAEDLKAQLAEHEEREKKAAAELEEERRRSAQERSRAEALARENTQVRTEANEAYFERIASSIDAAEIEASSAEAEYAAAMEKADFIAAAKAQRKIAGAEAKIVRLTEAKAYIEQQKKAPPQRQADPVEQYISRATPASQSWLRQHSDYVSDPSKNQKLVQAHYYALGEGHAADTPGYFEAVETKLGMRAPDRARDENGRFVSEPKAPPQRKQAAPPAAPVNNGGSIGGSSGPTTVSLSQIEARAATDGTHVWGKNDLKAGRIKDESLIGTPIGASEFARRKLAMKRAGLYDRIYTEQ